MPMKCHNSTMKKTPPDPFVEKLRKLIESDPDLTAAGLSVKAGLANSAIRAMFSGKNKSPRLDTARKICAALGTSYEVFMGEARTSVDQELVRIVSQLSEADRLLLLGFGQGLVAKQGSESPQSGEDGQ